jgi:Tol biopolymer transport system component
MRIAVLFTTLLYCFLLSGCTSNQGVARGATPTPSPSPTPKPKPLIAFLNQGNLWSINTDGAGLQPLAVTPEGQTIQDFVWSMDGSRVYFVVGRNLFEVVIGTRNVAAAGELEAPPGVAIDRLELSNDGKEIILHALDADAAMRIFAVTLGQRNSRELSFDQYASLSRQRSPTIRTIGEMSVSPDCRRVLFKDLAGNGEELFIADIETGVRTKISNLGELGGFEESVESEGGRRVIEASWSPDGRFIVFNPMQSCSETGLCYGRLFLVDVWGGAQLQLSLDMMINIPLEWTSDGKSLAYDDGSRIVIAEAAGSPKALSEGARPKWQPLI